MSRKNVGFLIQHPAGGGGFHDAIFRSIVECFKKKPELNLFILNGGHLDTMDPNYTGLTSYADTHNKLYKLINTHFLDGLVIIYTIGIFISNAEFNAFCSSFGNLPMITVLGTIPGIPSVCLNNSAGLRLLLNYLCDTLHYKKLAFLNGVASNPDAIERLNIFNAVLLKKGIIQTPYVSHRQHPLFFQGDFSEESGGEAAKYFLPLILKHEIDVIVAANDGMARGLILELRKTGIIVPGDVAVTGFDNTRSATAVVPSITTVEQPFSTLINRAVDWLETRLDSAKGNPDAEQAPVFIIEPKIIIRQSCGSLSFIDAQAASCCGNQDPGCAPEKFLPETELDALAQAFLTMLDKNEDENFYKIIRQLILRDLAAGKEISAWNQHIIKLLFYFKKKYKAPDDIIERILNNTFSLYSHLLQEIFLDEKTRKEDTDAFFLNTLANIGAGFDPRQFTNVILNHFHKLKIHSLFIYLYTKTGSSADSFRLHFAYKDGKILDIKSAEYQKLRTVNLGMLPETRPWRYSVHSLHYDWVALGFVLIEIDDDNAEGKIYLNLQEVFSTAIRGYVLMQQEIQALNTIRNLHKKLLPEIGNSVFGEYAVSAVSLPLTTGGGDIFNVYYQHNRLKLAIGDVTGHGVLAGMVMMLGLLSYQLLLKEEQIADSSVFLEKLNTRLYDIIAHNLELNAYTSFMIFQQKEGHAFEYAGQHNPPLVYSARNKRFTSLEASGIWLGIVDEKVFKNQMHTKLLTMETGDLLILYTDGITETFNHDGKLFGEEGIKRVVAEYVAENTGYRKDLKALRDAVISAVRRWGEPDDDMTLLIVCHL